MDTYAWQFDLVWNGDRKWNIDIKDVNYWKLETRSETNGGNKCVISHWFMLYTLIVFLLVFCQPSFVENVDDLIYTSLKIYISLTSLSLPCVFFSCLVLLWLNTFSSSHHQALWEKSTMLTSPSHYASGCPTEGFVSMPPNKSLVSVCWQNKPFRSLRKPTIHQSVTHSYSYCFHINQLFHVCPSPLTKLTKVWFHIVFTPLNREVIHQSR